MTKKARNSAATAVESFHKHYAAIWGQDRWFDSLYPALAKPTRLAALVNQYAFSASFQDIVKDLCDVEQLERVLFPDLDLLTLCKQWEVTGIVCFASKAGPHAIDDVDRLGNHGTIHLPPPKLVTVPGSSQRLMTHWNLDGASALVAHLLNVQPNDNVLDLCAAPGGKSIALSQSIWPQLHAGETNDSAKGSGVSSGHLISNEFDVARHKRLTANLKEYLPLQLHESKNVASLREDATDPMAARKFSIGGSAYDKVLVDAPCSSERHIIHAYVTASASGRTAPEMASWRPGSSKRLAKTQVDLLLTGLRAAKIGGSIMYATCSLETIENDGVIEKTLTTVDKEVKKGQKWVVKIGFNNGYGNEQLEAELEKSWAERTKYGWIVLPDHPSGGKWGPLFFVMLTKIAVTR